jgi:hypothetical protein
MCSAGCSRSIKGWVAGCATATGVMLGVVLVILAIVPGDNFGNSVIALPLLALVVFLFTCFLTGIPSAVVIWFSRRFQTDSAWFFGGTGAVIGWVSLFFFSLLSPSESSTSSLELVWLGAFFGMTGFVAGLAYWRMAGRFAGARRSDGQIEP